MKARQSAPLDLCVVYTIEQINVYPKHERSPLHPNPALAGRTGEKKVLSCNSR